MLSLTRLFQFPTKAGDSNFGKLSAVDISIFPDNTECRPVVTIGLVGSKLAFSTGGEDLLSAVPDSLTMFPYSFTSSLPRVSRVVTASNTKYPATSVVQPLLRAYFGGCRVREVNTAGIFIEDTCDVSNHWESYGLMVHYPAVQHRRRVHSQLFQFTLGMGKLHLGRSIGSQRHEREFVSQSLR
ncbi:hypothetical protein PI126_g24404 [Phytophthora idaei]|nr:hypothetical protein PI126_g24404 [Phytophthora idaei]